LREVEPRKTKLGALAGRAELLDSWADVWVIDENDDGLTFEGGPQDVVIFRCRERASAGYLWDEAQLEKLGFEVLADDREQPDDDACGGEVTRVLVTRVRAPGEYKVSFAERRPWQPNDAAALLSVTFDLQGKEHGLPRFARKTAISS
jgi:hypothetical protein